MAGTRMGAGIGAADAYYRLRLMRLDEVESPDFEWREDILYRRPPMAAPRERDLFRVEAVAIGDEEDATPLGVFENSDDAHEALDAATSDLGGLTRAEFEERYFPADA